MAWNGEMIPQGEIEVKVTDATVKFAEAFGTYLGTDDRNDRQLTKAKVTTSQLRRFFGEVKRQQMSKFNETDFVLLKPKLAYAVGRADKKSKMTDFFKVISDAVDRVVNEDAADKEKRFANFILVFESIVAYHKATVKD